ncbi:hypothetical protein [Paenibacillus dendrobii]|nr:hypothetical protein [Paenibacillus dendrobii]
MFNFQNLNDFEFELLSRDVVSKEFGLDLRTYTKGRDGGIDIRGFVANDVVVQVKHYPKSSFSNLKNSLDKEVAKIKKLNIKKYIVVTSFFLTPEKEDEIFAMFENYMDTKKQIIDGSRLNTILAEADNLDIVRKNYKLWLTSTNVLDTLNHNSLIIDTNSYIYEIDRKMNLFVETKQFLKALEVLEKNNCILLDGNPGVGKTTVSQMLITHFIKDGYSPKYLSNNSTHQIKNSLFNDDKKELILLNDFLGQHYEQYKPELLEEIKALINYFVKYPHQKKLILNTRITILNEVLMKNNDFKFFLEDSTIEALRIDVSQLTYFEKARILYSHIYYYKLPQKHFNQILTDKRYLQIIEHPNYNPRIIEYITRRSTWNSTDPESYFSVMMNHLLNPKDVWKNEFEKLSTFDRIFINTLYSLTNEEINIEILRECFEKRLNHSKYDTTINVFADCLDRLTDSLIKIVDLGMERFVGVINPSINDYIFHELQNNYSEIQAIYKHSVYFEQMEKLLIINKGLFQNIFIDKITTREFLSLKTYTAPIQYFYLFYIAELNIMNHDLSYTIHNLLFDRETYKQNSLKDHSILLGKYFCNLDMIQFYKLHSLFNSLNRMEYIYEKTDYSFMEKFIPIHEEYLRILSDGNILRNNIDDVIVPIRFNIKWAIELEIVSTLNYRMKELIMNKIAKYHDENLDDEFPDHIISNLTMELKSEISLLSDQLIKRLNSIIFCKRELKIDYDIILEESSFEHVAYQVTDNYIEGDTGMESSKIVSHDDDIHMIDHMFAHYRSEEET